MPVHVHQEPDVFRHMPAENCTDCRQPTRTWLTPNIPLCESCAQKRPNDPADALLQNKRMRLSVDPLLIHTSSMTQYQRNELVRILRAGSLGSSEEIMEMTDRQLHLTWLAACAYIDDATFKREFAACVGKPLFETPG